MSRLRTSQEAGRLPTLHHASGLARLHGGPGAGTCDQVFLRRAGPTVQEDCAAATLGDGRVGSRSEGWYLIIGGRLASGPLGEGHTSALPLPCHPDCLLRIVDLQIRVLTYEDMLWRTLDAPSLLTPSQPVGEAGTRPQLRVWVRRASRRHPFGSSDGMAATARRLLRSSAAADPLLRRELPDASDEAVARTIADTIATAVVRDERERRSNA